uniref:Uncharacterized protein n=1 Tax=Oryza punctata TaxID=4537 RepID=A0A0E0KHC3_ORYPU
MQRTLYGPEVASIDRSHGDTGAHADSPPCTSRCFQQFPSPKPRNPTSTATAAWAPPHLMDPPDSEPTRGDHTTWTLVFTTTWPHITATHHHPCHGIATRHLASAPTHRLVSLSIHFSSLLFQNLVSLARAAQRPPRGGYPALLASK